MHQADEEAFLSLFFKYMCTYKAFNGVFFMAFMYFID